MRKKIHGITPGPDILLKERSRTFKLNLKPRPNSFSLTPKSRRFDDRFSELRPAQEPNAAAPEIGPESPLSERSTEVREDEPHLDPKDEIGPVRFADRRVRDSRLPMAARKLDTAVRFANPRVTFKFTAVTLPPPQDTPWNVQGL